MPEDVMTAMDCTAGAEAEAAWNKKLDTYKEKR